MPGHYNSLIPRLFQPLPWKGHGAVTLFGTAYYTWPNAESVPAHIRREEEWHKVQQAEDGWRFYFWYLRDLIFYGYKDSPYEREAKEKSKAIP